MNRLLHAVGNSTERSDDFEPAIIIEESAGLYYSLLNKTYKFSSSVFGAKVTDGPPCMKTSGQWPPCAEILDSNPANHTTVHTTS